MRDVVVTGFAPFGGMGANPAGQIAEALGGAVLPVSLAQIESALADAVEGREPDLVLCLGLSERAPRVRIETLARNVTDFRIPDNDGAQPRTGEIVPGGTGVLYVAPERIAEVEIALETGGIEYELSSDAGLYLCNALLYLALSRGLPAIFVHVPLPSVAQPARIAEALRPLVG
jgi:pyroglutamyl-peptidase